MPTPTDLRQALDRLEAEAPPAARTRAAVLRRIGSIEPASRRTRWFARTGPLLVAAVVVVVALATIAVFAVRDRTADPIGRPSPPPATELVWSFDVPQPPTGTALQRIGISPYSQLGHLSRRDGSITTQIEVYAPDQFDPTTELSGRRTVEVQGRQGYFGVLDGALDVLVWSTPDGGWAKVTGSAATEPDQVATDLLEVASRVEFGRFGSPVLPFRLGWLPSGLSVQGAQSVARGASSDETVASVFFAGAGLGTSAEGVLGVSRIDESQGPFGAEIANAIGPDRRTLTVGGRPAVIGTSGRTDPNEPRPFNGRILAVDVGDGSALLVHVGDGVVDRYPDQVMIRIAEKADTSMSITDPKTWIPAPAALGG